MSSDKKVHLCRLKRMSLEAYRGTCRNTTGRACVHLPVLVPVLVLALVPEPPVVVGQEGPLKMVVRKVETGFPGGAGKDLNRKNNSGNGSSMV